MFPARGCPGRLHICITCWDAAGAGGHPGPRVSTGQEHVRMVWFSLAHSASGTGAERDLPPLLTGTLVPLYDIKV